MERQTQLAESSARRVSKEKWRQRVEGKKRSVCTYKSFNVCSSDDEKREPRDEVGGVFFFFPLSIHDCTMVMVARPMEE